VVFLSTRSTSAEHTNNCNNNLIYTFKQSYGIDCSNTHNENGNNNNNNNAIFNEISIMYVVDEIAIFGSTSSTSGEYSSSSNNNLSIKHYYTFNHNNIYNNNSNTIVAVLLKGRMILPHTVQRKINNVCR
jgi:hypothetical protein